MGTLERVAFIRGIYSELTDQYGRYVKLIDHLLELEARVDVAELSLRLVRDHLTEAIQDCQCPESELPEGTRKVLHHVRFIGRRAADACLEVLRERGQITMAELLAELNNGMFRFRTGSPEREINAALLRQPHVKRDGDTWIYDGPRAVKSNTSDGKEAQSVA